GAITPSAISRHTTPARTWVTTRTALSIILLRTTASPPHPSFGQRHLPALEQAPGYYEALNFARAFPDALDSQFAEKALGDVFPHVTPSSENLHGAIGNAACHLGRIEFCHGTLCVAEFPVHGGIDFLCAAVCHEASGPQLGHAVG